MTSTQLRPPPVTAFPVQLEHEARYSDLDPSRRIGRDAIARWFEDARVAVERDAFGADLVNRRHTGMQLLLASVRVEVLAPLRVTGQYRIAVGVTRIGDTSFTFGYGVFAGDECVATGESTSVHVLRGRPAPLPGSVRAALAKLRMEGPEPVRAEHDRAMLVRENYPFRLDIRTRFGDLDTNRHVNNVALVSWYLDALAELHLDVLGYPTGGPLDGLSPSALRVDYLAEVHYPGIHQLRVGVLDLDETAVRYACGLFDGSRCIGLAEAVGAHHAPGEDGDLVELARSFEPFRMRTRF